MNVRRTNDRGAKSCGIFRQYADAFQTLEIKTGAACF